MVEVAKEIHDIIIVILLMSLFCGTASAWLSGYDYRMAITVNNSGASELSYYQFNFTNDTNVLVAAGNMQASGADCRIADASDNLLPFWNDTPFNAAGTKIWANATTLAVGDNTFYMYYGNAGASSIVDGDSTFELFDDFEEQYPCTKTEIYNYTALSTWAGGVIGDADNDGSNELLIGTVQSSSLFLLEYNSTSCAWENRTIATNINGAGTNNHIWNIRLGDANLDGKNDILVDSLGSGLPNKTIFEINETAIVRENGMWHINGVPHTSGMCNLTNDGIPKIFNSYCNGGQTYIYEFNFTHSISHYIETMSRSGEPGCVGDLDNDGLNEAFVVNGWSSSGTIIYNWDFFANNTKKSSVTIDDTPHYCAGQITYGDVDNDGTNEVAIIYMKERVNGGGYGNITIYEFSGGSLTSKWVVEETSDLDTGYSENSFVIADADNDGENELIVGTRGRNGDDYGRKCARVYMYDIYPNETYKRQLLYDFSDVADTVNIEVGDGDNDGDNEIYAVTSNGNRATTTEPSYVYELEYVAPVSNPGIDADKWNDTAVGTAEQINGLLKAGNAGAASWVTYPPPIITQNNMHQNISIHTRMRDDVGGDWSGIIWQLINKTNHYYFFLGHSGDDYLFGDVIGGTTHQWAAWIAAGYDVQAFQDYEIRSYNGGQEIYRNGNLFDSNSANGLNGNNKIAFYGHAADPGYAEVDWIFVCQYASPAPTATLGAEENAPVNIIVLGANKYGMLRKSVTSAQTFSTIAGEFSHDICFTWLNSTSDHWESHYSGDSYNSAKSVPEHDSYFVLMDGTGETVSCGVAAAESITIPAGWSSTYLRESTSKTLTAIKADMGGNCADLYAWDHTASGTGAWNNTGAFVVEPNEGLLVNASTGFNWDGTVP